MYNLYVLLSCVILAIICGRMVNIEIPKKVRPLARTGGYVERDNFSYFYVHYHGHVTLNLTSLEGDADLYISDKHKYPTYDPDIYALHSATCGEDIIDVPESFESPLAVAVYGHADSSEFLLEIYENPKFSYSYKQWAVIDREIETFKDTIEQYNKKVDSNNIDNKKNSNVQTLKRKRKNASSSIPGVFSVLEILQLIFL